MLSQSCWAVSGLGSQGVDGNWDLAQMQSSANPGQKTARTPQFAGHPRPAIYSPKPKLREPRQTAALWIAALKLKGGVP